MVKIKFLLIFILINKAHIFGKIKMITIEIAAQLCNTTVSILMEGMFKKEIRRIGISQPYLVDLDSVQTYLTKIGK